MGSGFFFGPGRAGPPAGEVGAPSSRRPRPTGDAVTASGPPGPPRRRANSCKKTGPAGPTRRHWPSPARPAPTLAAAARAPRVTPRPGAVCGTGHGAPAQPTSTRRRRHRGRGGPGPANVPRASDGMRRRAQRAAAPGGAGVASGCGSGLGRRTARAGRRHAARPGDGSPVAAKARAKS